MELKEFIQTTLEDISNGVSGVKPKFKELGGEVNPVKQSTLHSCEKQTVNIEFEVSLADNSTSSTGKGIGVLLSVVSAGANKVSESELLSMTKVKFSVPVKLP
jgi:hypothetical protein